jgi:hypothetical protein
MSTYPALSRDIDVQVNVTKAQAELATNMTLLCLLVPGYTSGTRVKYYESIDEFIIDYPANTPEYWAGKAFFDRPDHPLYMAVGLINVANPIANEIEAVRAESIANAMPIYGWCLDASLRDTGTSTFISSLQRALSDWCETTKAICALASNQSLIETSGETESIAWYVNNKGYARSCVLYSDTSQEYPDVSYLAMFLGVNYSLPNSAITGKFKDLSGLTPDSLDSTTLAIIQSKRCNVFTLVGNDSRCVREGVQGNPTWFTDDTVNLDNFVEDLQTEIFNVFLRNKKVPYTPAGQNLIVSACRNICQKYVVNGVFADRPTEDPTNESGYTTLSAYSVVPQPIYVASASDRAQRLAPPVQIIAYLAGAVHKVVVNVNAIG